MKPPNFFQRLLLRSRLVFRLLRREGKAYEMLQLDAETQAILEELNKPSKPFHNREILEPLIQQEQYTEEEKTPIVYYPASVFTSNGYVWIEFHSSDEEIIELNIEPEWFEALAMTMALCLRDKARAKQRSRAKARGHTVH